MIERFIVDDAGSLIDTDTGICYDYFEEIVGWINEINTERLNNKKDLNTLKHIIKQYVID